MTNPSGGIPVDAKTHWENIYTKNASDAVSWYRRRLDVSLNLIERTDITKDSAIIDVGGGASTLVDDLLSREYRNVTVLDVSQKAIDITQRRLGSAAAGVRWITADITKVELEPGAYDLWHDRAVFHFLTQKEQRIAYVRQVLLAVKPGGHVIIGTFGPEGPAKCSGLNVVRYDEESLLREFGSHFQLIESLKEQHETPFRATQQFLYCYCRVEKSAVGKP